MNLPTYTDIQQSLETGVRRVREFASELKSTYDELSFKAKLSLGLLPVVSAFGAGCNRCGNTSEAVPVYRMPLVDRYVSAYADLGLGNENELDEVCFVAFRDVNDSNEDLLRSSENRSLAVIVRRDIYYNECSVHIEDPVPLSAELHIVDLNQDGKLDIRIVDISHFERERTESGDRIPISEEPGFRVIEEYCRIINGEDFVDSTLPNESED